MLKPDHCKKCKEYEDCVRICDPVLVDLYRYNGGRKKRIKPVPTAALSRNELIEFNNKVYAGGDV